MVGSQAECESDASQSRSSLLLKRPWTVILLCGFFFVAATGANANTGIPLVIANEGECRHESSDSRRRHFQARVSGEGSDDCPPREGHRDAEGQMSSRLGYD